MEEQNQPLTQEPNPQAAPVQPANVVNMDSPEPKKSKTGLWVAIIIIFVIAALAAAVMMLNMDSDEETAPAQQTATGSSEIKSDKDLSEVEGELDTADIDSYQTDLTLLEQDSSGF